MAGHLAVVYALRLCRKKQLFTDQSLQALVTRIFDAGAFATSLMLIFGVTHDAILKALGGTQPFLLFAGFAGVIYGLHAFGKSD